MANRATITYNGNTISTEDRDGNFAITYNGSTIATVGAGQTKTLNCANKVMRTNVVVGGKTLNCAKYKMATNVVISVVGSFPSQPTSYSLIGTYSSSQTWTAPEDGYFQIEVFGASGNGGAPYVNMIAAGGGGGGGGGYACSRVKMEAGNIVIFTAGAVGATSSAIINSTLENYSTLSVTSGANGGSGARNVGGTGGSGGVASGGNYHNANGNAGSTGSKGYIFGTGQTVSGGAGGTAGYTGGNVGGTGGGVIGDSSASPTSVSAGVGVAGYIKIYRGNTNTSGGGGNTPNNSVFYLQSFDGTVTREFEFEDGMTWSEFVSSNYNDGKFTFDNTTSLKPQIGVSEPGYGMVGYNDFVISLNPDITSPYNFICHPNLISQMQSMYPNLLNGTTLPIENGKIYYCDGIV